MRCDLFPRCKQRRYGVLALVVAALLIGAALADGAAERLPLDVGEVLVPTGSNSAWTFAGTTPGCTIRSQWSVPGPVALRCYDVNVTGRFTMSRSFKDLDSRGFDAFIVFFNNRGGEITARATLETDAGERASETVRVAGDWDASWTELTVPLNGAGKIRSLRLALAFTKKGRAGTDIYLHGLLLRNTREFAALLKHWDRFGKLKWEGLLQPEGFKPEFKLRYGLFFGDKDVEAYRAKHGKEYAARREEWRTSPAPERVIGSSVYAGECARAQVCEKYTRAFGRPCVAFRQTCGGLAFASLVTRDPAIMRLAARYALSLAACGSWNDDGLNDIVGGDAWPAFTPSGVTLELAFALDCAGEMLTRRGREYVLKAMMLKGVAPITYSMWARSFAWESNQGMVFLRGKMAALLVFDRTWRHVRPMLEATKAEADEIMNTLFRPDGGYMESTAYMAYTISCAEPLYEMYAHVSGKKITEVLPRNLSRSGAYADVVASTCRDPRRAVISIGQAHTWRPMDPLSAAFLAVAVPNSLWVNLYRRIPRKEISERLGYCGQGYGLRLERLDRLARAGREARPRPLVVLPESGLVSSTRGLDGEPVKIVMVGDSLGVGKKHHDSGSFVLEFAGESFAMDMPVYSGLYEEAQYHNMLVPILAGGRLGDSIPYTDSALYRVAEKRNSQRPRADGDATRFTGVIDSSDAWKDEFFRKSVRTIRSPRPDRMVIIDEYVLGEVAKGVAFVWLTYLPAKKTQDGRVVITTDRGARAELTPPVGASVEIERFSPGAELLKAMALPEGHKCSRILFRKAGEPGRRGRFEVRVRLMAP